MKVVNVSLKQAQDLCRQRKATGKWFGVSVEKRGDNSLRRMIARGGVKALLKGGELKFDPAKKRVLGIYDAVARNYRFINLDGLKEVRVTGTRYVVVPKP